MNKDDLEGAARSTVGQVEQVAGDVLDDKSIKAEGRQDEVAGKAQSAVGNVKSAISNGADAVAALDFSSLRDEVANLAQTVAELAQERAATARDQLSDAVGSAVEGISQSTADAQDKLTSLESAMSSRIRRNPWTAVAMAAIAGILIAKLS